LLQKFIASCDFLARHTVTTGQALAPTIQMI